MDYSKYEDGLLHDMPAAAAYFQIILRSEGVLLTIHHFFPAFDYGLFRLAPKWAFLRKTMGFGSQYAAYWNAKPCILACKMQGFGL